MRTTRSTVARRTALAAATALVLAGCAGTVTGQATDDGSDPPATTTSAEPTEEPTEESDQPSSAETSEPEDETTSAAPPASLDGLTPPGTTLAFGEPAQIPLVDGSNEGVVSMTVTVQAGTAEEVAGVVEAGDLDEGEAPLYVTSVITNVSGSAFEYATQPFLRIRGADGSGGYVNLERDFPLCPYDTGAEEFSTTGAVLTTCVIYSASPGVAVTVEYGDSSDLAGDAYADEPLVWG